MRICRPAATIRPEQSGPHDLTWRVRRHAISSGVIATHHPDAIITRRILTASEPEALLQLWEDEHDRCGIWFMVGGL